MCKFVAGEFVAPGIGCCKCKAYNGLQREQCKMCRHVFCAVEIPPEVNRCLDCGWGWIGEMPKANLLGPINGCPCCAAIAQGK